LSDVLSLIIASIFFISNNPHDKSFIIEAKEATFAQHAALRDSSFKITDCSSQMISRAFDLTFSFCGTKNEAIALKILTPL
jgi:hypothetical protein